MIDNPYILSHFLNLFDKFNKTWTLKWNHQNKLARVQKKVQLCMCAQYKLKSVCVSTEAYQSIW